MIDSVSATATTSVNSRKKSLSLMQLEKQQSMHVKSEAQEEQPNFSQLAPKANATQEQPPLQKTNLKKQKQKK